MSWVDKTYATAALSDEERNRLVEDYLPLVRHVVGRLPLTLPAFMDVEDLFEVGVLGLMNAARTYNPGRGAQFKTHAYVNIRGAVLDELRRHDMVPRSRRDRIKLFRRTVEELEDELSRAPTPEEIAEAMGLSVAQVDDLLVNMQTAVVLSLDDAAGDGDEGARLADCVACVSTPRPADDAERRELEGELARLIQELPEKERHVIVLYYAEGLLLKEIGAAMGVTESRISQIHSRALLRLNQGLASGRERV